MSKAEISKSKVSEAEKSKPKPKASEGEKDLLSLFGEDTLYLDGDIAAVGNYDIIRTGSPSLDYALGIGGLPRGRIIQFAGKESSGKTLLSLMCIKSWLEENPENTAMYIDAEYTYDPSWIKKLGIDPARIIVAKTNESKRIFEGLLGKMVVNKTTGKSSKGTKGVLDLIQDGTDAKFKNLGIIVLDSVAAMNTPMEVDAAIGKQNMAPMPRFLSTELKKLTPAVAGANVAMIFINQVRTDPGVMYGNPECVDPYSTKVKIRCPIEQDVFVSELFERITTDFDFSTPGIFDVSSSKIEIESFDFNTGKKTFSLIRNLIVKEPVDFYYKIGELRATAGHLIYDEFSSKFIRADEHPNAERVNEKMFVIDFTIDETHNYFANGQLNHNTSPGGRALKHACSAMINMAPINSADSRIEDDNEVVIGHKVKAKIQKNKVGAPFREAIYTIKYVEGIINKEEELLDVAIICGVITRPNKMSYEVLGTKIVGRESMIEHLKDKDAFKAIEDLCREKYISGQVSEITEIVDSDEDEEGDGSFFDEIEEG